MNQPHNKSNFLIEITPEVLDELRQLYAQSDIEPVVELHYSPYWTKQTNPEAKESK